MPLHPSQVFEQADELIDRAFAVGESYQSIAKMTEVHDSTVRNWKRRKRAKLAKIKPLLDHVIQMEHNAEQAGTRQKSAPAYDFNELIHKLKIHLAGKLEKYLANDDIAPLEDAQLLKILIKIQDS